MDACRREMRRDATVYRPRITVESFSRHLLRYPPESARNVDVSSEKVIANFTTCITPELRCISLGNYSDGNPLLFILQPVLQMCILNDFK